MKDAIYTWERRRIAGNSMPRQQLKDEIEQFIKARCNCSMATGYGTYIRNTPMRYSYKDGIFTMISEGGYKFKGLSQNSNVCLTIFDSDKASNELIAVTVEGEAQVTEFTEDGGKPGTVRRFFITVKPKYIDYQNTNLSRRGFYVLQRLSLGVE